MAKEAELYRAVMSATHDGAREACYAEGSGWNREGTREALKYSGFRSAAVMEATVSVGVATRDANKSAFP